MLRPPMEIATNGAQVAEDEVEPDVDETSPVEAGEEHEAEEAQAPDEDRAQDEAEDGEEQPELPLVGPGDDLDDVELDRRLAALLFGSAEPLPLRRLVNLLERPKVPRVKEALARLRTTLAEGSLPLELQEIAGAWRVLTSPDQGEILARLKKTPKVERITAAALETLAIVAYRQPVTKAEVEAIRGVQSGPMLRSLVDRGLARVTGRADQPGAPLQSGTTKSFLDSFGLANLDQLPRDGELSRE